MISLVLLLCLQTDDCWQTFLHPDGAEYVQWVCEGEPPGMEPVTTSVTLSEQYSELFECCVTHEVALARCEGARDECRYMLYDNPPFNFQHCMSGPLGQGLWLHVQFLGCKIYDVDDDGDIDLKDWSKL